MSQATVTHAKRSIPKNIPIEALIQLDRQGLTYEEIGKRVGLSKWSVWQRFKTAGYMSEHLQAYKDSRADVLAYYQQQILSSLSEADLKKASLQVKIMAFGILYDKERLERGQSTSNISAITSIIQAVHDRKPQPIVVSDDPIISIDSPVTGSPDIPGQLPVPCPEIEGGRGGLVADSVIIPPYDPPVE